MCEIISIINQKGGVGKSTTALELARGLKIKGFAVLSIDLDAQANLTYSMRVNESKKTILQVLTGIIDTKDAIFSAQYGDIIPASKNLSNADNMLTETGKEYKLKEALEQIKNDYDFIIIDTPPALSILTVNALTASDSVIIPAQADIFSIQGIQQLHETIKPVVKYCNANLKIDGILLTRFNARSTLSKEIAEALKQLAASINTRLFNTAIRESVKIREAQIKRLSIFDYDPLSNIATDYKAIIEELLSLK